MTSEQVSKERQVAITGEWGFPALRRAQVARYDRLRAVPTFEPPPHPDGDFNRGLCAGVAISLVFWVGCVAMWLVFA